MNFDQAIEAHLQWWETVIKHINDKDITLDTAVIAKSNECVLGKWLESIKYKYSGHPDFIELFKTHIDFHKAVAAIVKERNNNPNLSIQEALGQTSHFRATSKKMITLLMKLKDEFQED